jgi:succinoglycan biosynthesis transport protein ExoP
MRIALNSPQAIVALLVRRRWWIIAPFLALTGIVVVLTNNLPRTYISSTLILVQPRDIPANFVVDLIAGTVDERLNSIKQTVLSRTNIVSIIQEFGDQMPELQRLNMDGQVKKIQGQIGIVFQGGDPQVAAGRKPITFFHISYQNQDRFLAQKIANKLTQLFLKQDDENRADQVTGTKDFFLREYERVSLELEASEARLKQMRGANQYELPERLDSNLRRLETLAQDARTIEESISRNTTLRLNYEQMLNDTPPTIVKPGATVAAINAATPSAPAEDQKVTDARKAKLAYEQMAAIYPEKNLDLRAMKYAYEGLKSKLSPEELAQVENPPPPPPAPVSAQTTRTLPPGTEPNPRFQLYTESLRTAETEYKILVAKREQNAKEVEMYKRRIESTPQIEVELADAVRENKDLQKQYDDVKTKLSAAELSASLENQQKGGQFKVQDLANLPIEPAKPKKKIVALAGTAGCLVLSIIFAVFVDIARQRVWTQSEVEAFWGVPVLVDIPQILTDQDLAADRKKKWVFAAGALVASLVLSVFLYGVHLKHEFILRQLDPVLQKTVYK